MSLFLRVTRNICAGLAVATAIAFATQPDKATLIFGVLYGLNALSLHIGMKTVQARRENEALIAEITADLDRWSA